MFDKKQWSGMFWLFRRRKIADRRPVSPCVCENDPPVQGFRLREFASTIDKCLTPKKPSEGTLSRISFADIRRGGKQNYRKLQAEAVVPVPEQQCVPPPQPQPIISDLTSSPSSTEYSDYEQEVEDDSCQSEDDEALTCNVCDRSFHSMRQLEKHQLRKRHYLCSICDSIFPNLMALEHHKEVLDHWSEDECHAQESDSDDDSTEEDVGLSEDMERLL